MTPSLCQREQGASRFLSDRAVRTAGVPPVCRPGLQTRPLVQTQVGSGEPTHIDARPGGRGDHGAAAGAEQEVGPPALGPCRSEAGASRPLRAPTCRSALGSRPTSTHSTECAPHPQPGDLLIHKQPDNAAPSPCQSGEGCLIRVQRNLQGSARRLRERRARRTPAPATTTGNSSTPARPPTPTTPTAVGAI